MATNMKKGKGNKDGDKKGSKKGEEATPVEEKKEETPPEEPPETPVPEEAEVVEPPPEPVYEEPVLTKLIVERYEGDKEKGLYEGDGESHFFGGHHYVGEFHEGLMHGSGTYKWEEGLQYQGELTKNQVTGKGEYTWLDGSVYEGEVHNGWRNGFGTFRSVGEKMSYTGEWQMGKRTGKGRMEYDSDGRSFYEGDWIDNIRHGWGTRQYPSGNMYQGMWYNNVRHGDGTMRWLDKDQLYSGQWEDGIQHGIGQHVWFLKRVPGSQYPLRNMYDGDFVKGLRDGCGSFYYANGARYEGEWKNNMKHGKGKFIFKNGRVYEGTFDKDHIVEYPTFTMDGVTTPDMTQIRTRTPLPTEQASLLSNDSRNTYSPSFQLEVEHLLQDLPEADREDEAAQVIYVIMRHISKLRAIYNFYSGLGFEGSPDNTYIMNRMQFWRFLKDCRVHHNNITLMEMDRYLLTDDNQKYEMHNPYGKILFREYLNDLVTLAYRVYSFQHEGNGPMLSWCMSKLISDNILRFSCSVRGNFYHEGRRATNALVHMDQSYEIYRTFCKTKKGEPMDYFMTMRDFLLLIKDLNLLSDDLTPKAIISTFEIDDPNVTDPEGAVNLELHITFLEFFEALLGCAEAYVTEAVVKDPATPRPSTTITRNRSLLSMTSRGSHILDEEGVGGIHSSMTGESTPRTLSPKTARGSQQRSIVSETQLKSDASLSRSKKTGSSHGDKESEMESDEGHDEKKKKDKKKKGKGKDEKPEKPEKGAKAEKKDKDKKVDKEEDAKGKGKAKKGKKEAGVPVDGKDSSSSKSKGKKGKSARGSALDAKKEEEEENPESPDHQIELDEFGNPIYPYDIEMIEEECFFEEEEEMVEEEDFQELEDLDEETKLFNFWTHQIHIFFVRKFFPAAQKMAILKQRVNERYQHEA